MPQLINGLKNKLGRSVRSFSKAVGAQPSFEEYILGDENGRTRDPDDSTLWLVRKSDDSPAESVPWLMLGMFPTDAGTGVVVGWHMGQRGIYSANYRQIVSAGRNPNLQNTGDTALQGWFSKRGYPSLIAKAIGTLANPSTLIMVEAADWIDEQNIYHSFRRGQVDAVSYIPSAGLQRLVLVVMLSDMTLAIVSGATRAAGIALSPLHIQQVVENKPPRSIPLAIYRLVGGQSSVTEADKVGDMRELLNTQIPPRMNFTATTDPAGTDDSDSGYGVGSFWTNRTTPKTFVCDDDTPGAAVWSPLGGSGSPADATYIVQVADGDLPNAQALDALTDGLLKKTSGGVLATATAGTDYLTPAVIDTDAALAANSDTLVPSQKAIKTYVDAISQGFSLKIPVLAATTAALAANTYANGTAGLGATLTGNSNGALAAQDGQTLSVNDRLLVKNESSADHNGIYTVTQVGDGSHPYILTRSTDMDKNTEVPGAYVLVLNGTINNAIGYVVADPGPFTVGTTAIDWVQFNAAGQISVNAPIQKSGNTISHANSGVSAGTYPYLKAVIDAFGHITNAEAGINFKEPCVSCVTALILPAHTYNNGAGTITGNSNGALPTDGGVGSSLNDRILVKDSSDPLENGIYTQTQQGDLSHPFILTRAADMNTGDEFPGALVLVRSGKQNGGSWFYCTNTTAPVLGTNGIFFAGTAANWDHVYPMTAKGDLPTMDNTPYPANLSVGSDEHSLVADSTQTLGLKYAQRLIRRHREAIGLDVRKLDNATLYVFPGQVEVNSTLVEKTAVTKLGMATGGDWIGGSSNEGASLFVYVYIDASGNIKLHHKPPNVPTPAAAVATMLVNQSGWNGTASSGLNATTVVYDNDTGEGSVTEGMLAVIYESTDSDYSVGRGRSSASGGSRNVIATALVTAINTSTNTLTLEAGHGIGIRDNDRIAIVPFGAFQYRQESSVWYRLIGMMYNDGSSNLDADRIQRRATRIANESSNYSISSATYASIDTTKLSFSILASGALDVEFHFHGGMQAGTSGIVGLDVLVDGVRHGGNDGILVLSVGTTILSHTFTRTVKLLPGTHTFEIQWRVSTGSLTLYCSSAVSNFFAHPQFTVREIAIN